MMTQVSIKRFFVFIACMTLVSGVALAEETADPIAALEARVTALEEQVAQLLEAAQEEETPPTPDSETFSMGAPLLLEEGKAITVTSFDTGTRFRYSPAGGFSTLTLSSKSGYRLLCLYMTVDNDGMDNLSTSKLLDAELLYGADYTNKAQDTFFYRNSMGFFTGGLKSIGPRTSVDGCLLFAVPEDIDESRSGITLRLSYEDEVFECVLREGGARLEPSSDLTSF